MRKYLALVFVVLSVAAHATENNDHKFGFLVGGWSKHFKEGKGRNETNQLIAVSVDNWIVGTYENSFYDRSYMTDYDFHWNSKYIDYGILTGAISGYCGPHQNSGYDTGYACSTGGFVPLLMPYVSYSQFKTIQPTIGMTMA